MIAVTLHFDGDEALVLRATKALLKRALRSHGLVCRKVALAEVPPATSGRPRRSAAQRRAAEGGDS